MAEPDRDHLLRLLGNDIGPAGFASAQTVARRPFASMHLDDLVFHGPGHTEVPAFFLHPDLDTARPVPAVLYCHAHGFRFDIGRSELIDGRTALAGPFAADLAAAGYAVLCLEMPCFGARADMDESATSKALLWNGRTLFGQMLAEQAAGIGFLAAQRGIDRARIAALGLSMGGTLAWWLAALDARLCAAASMCCFADLACLVATGGHDGHGHYMTVPGLLAHCSTGALSGLAAPRPLLHCVGLADWSTPERCFEVARRDLEAAYRAAGAIAQPEFHVEPAQGHVETRAMRNRVLDFLERHLAAPGRRARAGLQPVDGEPPVGS